jgi:hypothetical protein
MKNLLALSLLVLSVTTISLNAEAIPSYPRDLTCLSAQGAQVQLQSNNGFWSLAQNGRYYVQLLVRQNGLTEIAIATYVNSQAQATRGNDQGIRKYVFTTSTGATYSVVLEFIAPFGLAKGIKTFTVTGPQSNINIDASIDSCSVKFYPRIEI